MEHNRGCQSGFTQGVRIEFILFMLQYITDKALDGERKRNHLIFVAINFKEAYVSINRRKLIETLVKYRFYPKIIEMMAFMYDKDSIVVKRDWKLPQG